jgi:methionyl-tRNA formyltransferase
MLPPPVKALADRLGIPTSQPERLHKDSAALAQLRAWNPDLIVVAAFGQILRPGVLDLPPHGCLNIHASLLPRWRGAAPIQAAILHGDSQTGVTIMKMDPGVDTGPILSQRALSIDPADTAGTLAEKLAQLGAALLQDTLPAYLAGEIQPQQQQDALATFAPMLQKNEGNLDFARPAEYLARQVRAFQPWPGASLQWSGGPLKIHAAHSEAAESPGSGVFVIHAGWPAVGASTGLLVLDRVQPAGKKAMPGRDFLRGVKTWQSQT